MVMGLIVLGLFIFALIGYVGYEAPRMSEEWRKEYERTVGKEDGEQQ